MFSPQFDGVYFFHNAILKLHISTVEQKLPCEKWLLLSHQCPTENESHSLKRADTILDCQKWHFFVNFCWLCVKYNILLDSLFEVLGFVAIVLSTYTNTAPSH